MFPRASTFYFAALIIAGFLAATLFTEVRANRLDALAHEISDDAVPSLAHLSHGSEYVRTVEAAVGRMFLSPDKERADDRAQIERSRQDARRLLDEYAPLATFEDERYQLAELDANVANLNRAVDRALAASEAEHAAEQGATIVHDVTDAADRVSQGFQHLVDLNLRQARLRSTQIAQVRGRLTAVAFSLDALIALLGGTALYLGRRATRREATLRVEHERLLEQRNSELEMFASRVAHDIKGPLSTLLPTIDTIDRGRLDGTAMTSAIARCRRSVGRVVTIVDGLLNFARAGARPSPSDSASLRGVLNTLVEDQQEAARLANVVLKNEPTPDVVVACSPGVLTSIVSNLVSNAFKFMDDGPCREVTVRASETDSRIRIEVEDSGPGVASEMTSSIFELYARGPGSQPGLGLGLATAKQLVTRHGGAIGVSPAPCKGSVFWVELPRRTVFQANPSTVGQLAVE